MIDEPQPYHRFRARLRESLSSRGWEIVSSDDEADFFALGPWEVYAGPADGLDVADPRPGDCRAEFHRIAFWRFSSEQDRVTWDVEPGRREPYVEEPEPIGVVKLYSVEDAVALADIAALDVRPMQ